MERTKKTKGNQGVPLSLNTQLSQYHSVFLCSFQQTHWPSVGGNIPAPALHTCFFSWCNDGDRNI